jgi:lysozyme
MPIDIEQLVKELKRDEGFRDKVYQCTAGKLTCGFGHNLEDGTIPEYVAESLLAHDIAVHLQECEDFPWFSTLSDVRKRVIINMMFNMGKGRLMGFKRMIEAINDENWEWAATEMTDSIWFHQVGDRAKRLVAMMRDDK